METVSKRAEVVAQDTEVADRFRGYLEGLHYSVVVKTRVELASAFDVDLVVYHVSPDAAEAERRHEARPHGAAEGSPEFWLDAVQLIRERAPAVPVLVAVGSGADGDKALRSGATDVIEETTTPMVFRRRLEMAHHFVRWPPELVEEPPPAPSHPPPRAAGSPRGRKGVLAVPLARLRNPASGRIDAERVAGYLGIPLRRLAEAMGIRYAGLHKTPDAPRVQAWLRPVLRVLELADATFGSEQRVRMWLNRPLYELENESPLAVLLAGEAGAVETLLANARSGIPG